MTLRDRLNKIAERVRGIPASASFDERPTSVTIRHVTYQGGRRHAEGPTTTVDVVITPTPKVRQLTSREIAASAGLYNLEDVRVGPITPPHPSGGYTAAQLAPVATANGVDIFYVLAGFMAGEYTKVSLNNDRSHSWFLVLRRRRPTP